MFLFFHTLLLANPNPPKGEPVPENLPPTEENPNPDTPKGELPKETTFSEHSQDPSTEEIAHLVAQTQEKDSKEKETLEQLLLLLNEQTPRQEREALLDKLHIKPGVLSSLENFSLHAPIELRKKILTLLLAHPEEPVTYNIARKTLQAQPSIEMYEHTFELLVELNNVKAASILKTQMENTSHPTEIRRRIQELLEQRYSEWYAENPSQKSITDFSGRLAFSVGSSVLGASVFSALGQIGQGEDGSEIGTGTGIVVGAVGGALYTQEKSISLGSALYFTHASSWGTIAGSSLGTVLDLDQNGSSIFRAMGSLGGAAYGIHTLKTKRTVRDVIEANIIHGESIFLTQSLSEAMGLAYYEDEVFLVGSLAGFGLSELITPTWHPNGNTILLAGIYGFEGLFLGESIYEDSGYENEGISSLLFHSGIVLAGLQEHYSVVNSNTIGMTAYGAYTGHMLGMGIGNLQNEGSVNLHTALGGTLGTAVGTLLSSKTPELTPSYLLGSTILVQVNTFAASSIINAVNGQNNTVSGMTHIATGLGNIGMGYFRDRLNLTGEKSLFLTSTSFWGTYLTGSTIALFDVDPTELGTSIVLLTSFDAGLGAGVYLLNRPNFEIRSTINPQLFAIIGGSLGSFGAYLINNSTQSLALGSLIGVGIGGYMGTKYKIKIPKSKFFDDFFLSAAPRYTPEGDIGVQINFAGLLGGPQ